MVSSSVRKPEQSSKVSNRHKRLILIVTPILLRLKDHSFSATILMTYLHFANHLVFFGFTVTGFDLWGSVVATGIVCTFYCTLVRNRHDRTAGTQIVNSTTLYT